MKTIDCRNLSCPLPVITVKKELETVDGIAVRLDEGAAHENVTRFARNRGYSITEQPDGTGWLVTINKGNVPASAASPDTTVGVVVMVTSSRLGDGPEELGKLLMKNFIHTLLETEVLPEKMFFLNSGVFLTCDGSDVLEALGKLQGMGVELFSCGLCLDYYNLKNNLRAGSTTNMLATIESLNSAQKVIKLS